MISKAANGEPFAVCCSLKKISYVWTNLFVQLTGSVLWTDYKPHWPTWQCCHHPSVPLVKSGLVYQCHQPSEIILRSKLQMQLRVCSSQSLLMQVRNLQVDMPVQGKCLLSEFVDFELNYQTKVHFLQRQSDSDLGVIFSKCYTFSLVN